MMTCFIGPPVFESARIARTVTWCAISLGRPVQAEGTRQEHVGTIVERCASAATGDSRRVQSFDESMEWMSNGHVAECRSRRIRTPGRRFFLRSARDAGARSSA
jgi:hypothetical protein